MSLADSFSQYKSGLILVLAVLVSGGVGFAVGRWGQVVPDPVKLEVANKALDIAVTAPVKNLVKNFVASKNGTRYYLPDCPGVNRIKEENKIWFASVEEARARGLTPAANCPGL